MKLIWIFCLIFLLVFCVDKANAGELNQRLKNFPEWEKLTDLQPAVGDLIYPEWMKGEWEVKSTLIDLVAPLAPDIITPGFESNRQYLNQPVEFKVRFVNNLKDLTPSLRTPLSFTRRGAGEPLRCAGSPRCSKWRGEVLRCTLQRPGSAIPITHYLLPITKS